MATLLVELQCGNFEIRATSYFSFSLSLEALFLIPRSVLPLAVMPTSSLKRISLFPYTELSGIIPPAEVFLVLYSVLIHFLQFGIFAVLVSAPRETSISHSVFIVKLNVLKLS